MIGNTVTLHIDRLVLDGFPAAPPRSTVQIQIAIQSELTRLLAQNGLPQTGYALRSIAAPAFHVVPDAAPSELGKNIAQSIFESLKRGR